jgi:hypothetical protein
MAQQTQMDSIVISTRADSLDSLYYKLWPNLLRSAIVPGFGQLQQNHPGRAVIFYGLNMYMIFNTIHYYNRYKETRDHAYKVKFYSYLGLSIQIYALNLLDVIDSYRNRRYQPWPEDLFSDVPIKSPWGAVARSAMLPGWGQLYNESYIKAVVAFGLCFDFARKIIVYDKRYRDTGNPSQKERRIVNTWYFGLVYFLNMVDAYVDAYLFRFNDSMELTFNVVPLKNTMTFGVVIVF